MLPPIRNARPPNIRISVTPGSPAISLRMQLARSSSYAMSCEAMRSLALSDILADAGVEGAGDAWRPTCAAHWYIPYRPVVGVAQLVELLVVVQAVGGSSPL